jgi:hypothetical protein
MYNSYTIKTGDTLEKISRSLYGTPEKAKDIGVLNGITEPLQVGLQIKYTSEETPNSNSNQKGIAAGQKIKTSSDFDNVKITINGVPLIKFESYEYSESLIGIRKLVINTYWDKNNPQLKSAFKFGNVVTLHEKGELIFTGYVKSLPMDRTSGSSDITLVCKSKMGILLDSCFPLSAYPIEFNKMSLRQILDKCASIKGLTIEYAVQAPLALDAILENDFLNGVAARVNESIFSFMIRLTKSKGLIITDTPNGGVKIFKAIQTAPVGTLIHGKTRGFSSIVCNNQLDTLAETYTVHSQYKESNAVASARIEGFPLPITMTSVMENNTQDNIEDLAKWWCCREVGKAIKYQISLGNFLFEGKAFKTGTFISITSEDLEIINKLVIVESIHKIFSKGEKIILTCTLPKAYTGELPTMADLL